ncbi:hypothetical protein BD560DRAFT_106013 [Blakeslea trispora]|nr:hypothetical protein BD560DRAFT_106013 [Blakeslea trispora]
MSTPPPKHSLSSPTSANTPHPVLPTPSSSTTVSRSNNRTQQQQRQELEQQLAEKQKQLQESSSGIKKNVLARQVSQLEDKLREMDTQSPDDFPQSQSLAGSAVDRLKSLERDLSSYRSHPLSPGISSIRGKEKVSLLNPRSPTPTSLDPLPSPTTSTLLPPAHGHDSTSLLPLPPPPTGSTPTKRRSKVPNADRRNTDIEFATEIGQGLLLEVRKMQALLQEKEEKLRTLENQKADLERAAEAMAKQMRQREENEEKLKEETWNLELAKQELVISVTDLQSNLTKANAEHNKLAKQVNELRSEIEQLRDREEKLNKSIETMKQRHEQDMSSIRRHAAAIQREKADQTKQIEALTSELAIAKAQSRIGKHTSSESESNNRRPTVIGNSALSDQGHSAMAVKSDTSPSSSPPSSPKQSPARNQAMEVETLKSSLAHAHRMVSNLRSGLHKEKNEKFELKKLLAESQETIEHLQNDPHLWVDTSSARATGSSSGPSSRNEDGSRRTLKANKRRGGKKNTSDSNAGKRKAKLSKANARVAGEDDDQNLEDEEEYSDLSDNEESDADSYDESEVNSPDITTGGFTSLSSELSKSQKPIAISTEVNTDPIEGLSMQRTSLADELANTGSRSLGDELSAAMSRSGTEEVLKEEEKPEGIEISTQTDIEPSAPSKELVEISVQTDTLSVFSEISTQTEPHAPLEQKHIQPLMIEPIRSTLNSTSQAGIDIAPEDPEIASAALAAATAAAIAAARQAAIESAIDVSTQSEAILTQDHETQSVPIPSLDQGVQSESFEGVDCGIQSELNQSVDASVQSDAPVPVESKDASIQHEESKDLADVGVAAASSTEHIETIDESTQCDFDLPMGIDHSTQSVALETTDSSVQSDSPVTVDADIQYEPIVSNEIGVQALLVPETKDAEVQYEISEEAIAAALPIEEEQDEFFDATSKPSSKNTTKQNNALKAILAAPLIAPALLASKLMNKQKEDKDEAIVSDKDVHDVVTNNAEPKAEKVTVVVGNEKDSVIQEIETSANTISKPDQVVGIVVDKKDTSKVDVIVKDNDKIAVAEQIDTTTNVASDAAVDKKDTEKTGKSDTITEAVKVGAVGAATGVIAGSDIPADMKDEIKKINDVSEDKKIDNAAAAAEEQVNVDHTTTTEGDKNALISKDIESSDPVRHDSTEVKSGALKDAESVTDKVVVEESKNDTDMAVSKPTVNEVKNDENSTVSNVAPSQDEKLYTKSEMDAMIAAAVASALATASVVKSQDDSLTTQSTHNGDDDQLDTSESTEHHTPSEKALGKRPSSELHSNLEQGLMPSIITTPSSRDDLLSQEEMSNQSTQPTPASLLSRAGLSPSEMSHADKLESLSISSVSTNNTNEQLQSVTSSNYDPRSGTDPNVIQLITQTMVGDWLYKYTRKMVGGGISEKRHQRYFWLHPYSRRLFWSTSAPISDGNEGKAKCAVIEDISVVSDSNTSPEGTPNISLLIQTSHRQIKLTAPNINVHDRWFEVSNTCPSV